MTVRDSGDQPARTRHARRLAKSRSSGQSAPPHRGFLKRLPAALIVGMLVWLILRPAIDVAVTRFAEVLVRAFEYPRVTRLVPVDHRVEVRRADFRADSAIPTVPLTEIHFNLIVLLALSLALRRPFSRRQLERLVMGCCVLIVIQGLNLVFHVKCIYAFSLGEWSEVAYSDLARNVFGFLRYFTDLPARFAAPFLIWLGFDWDRVMALVGTRDEQEVTNSRPSAKRRSH